LTCSLEMVGEEDSIEMEIVDTIEAFVGTAFDVHNKAEGLAEEDTCHFDELENQEILQDPSHQNRLLDRPLEFGGAKILDAGYFQEGMDIHGEWHMDYHIQKF
jgi:hypothetical protein